MQNINYPHITKDSKGNTIHYKQANGYEYWNEYDEMGNLIHHKISTGLEWWRKYDKKGNIVHYKEANGYECHMEYDEKGNMIYYKDSGGHEFWYDSNGNKIPNPNQVQELTLDQIAAKFGIKVENLKIKK